VQDAAPLKQPHRSRPITRRGLIKALRGGANPWPVCRALADWAERNHWLDARVADQPLNPHLLAYLAGVGRVERGTLSSAGVGIEVAHGG
jgi:hypothetical protein